MSGLGKVIALQPMREDRDSVDSGGLCAQTQPFALLVKGDSMEPEFCDGHIIMVDPSMPVAERSYVIADDGQEYIFRQWRLIEGKAHLVALNKQYPVIKWVSGHTLVGVITQRTGRRRREIKRYESC